MRHTLTPLACSMFLLIGCGLVGCGQDSAPAPEVEAAPPTETETETAAGRRARDVQARVEQAQERLAQSEGGRLVWAAIEAHGGLGAWLSAGTIEFAFDYAPIDEPARRMNTFQRIDLWSARAVHEELEGGAGERARFGFDGENAWIVPNADAFPTPARFWSLTPYYFVAMPFVLADPGTLFEVLPQLELDGRLHDIVKVTYEAGTGDSPDDYYVLYFDAETHRVSALRYIVAYPGFFEPGQHSPEKLMRYSEPQEIEGVSLATRYDTYRWADGAQGDKVTEIEASRFALGRPIEDSEFAAPEGAVDSPLAPPAR